MVYSTEFNKNPTNEIGLINEKLVFFSIMKKNNLLYSQFHEYLKLHGHFSMMEIQIHHQNHIKIVFKLENEKIFSQQITLAKAYIRIQITSTTFNNRL